ncbi:MAG: DUF6157 family protein [Microthrixaceae bacterium]|nr:hypothetical protein [Microthrixaceae bacterium]
MEPTYANTLISVADDCPVGSSKRPEPRGGQPTVAMLQYAMVAEEPFTHTMGDVLFGVWLQRQHPDGEAEALAPDEVAALREGFFAKDQPCLRTSPLAKTHGWGFVFDGEGRVALCPMESDEYAAHLADGALTVRPAMRSKRAR